MKAPGLYPDNWNEIALDRKEEVKWVCELCGEECQQPDEIYVAVDWVLSVAHLNHQPWVNHDENLMCLCWLCHIEYDAWENARKKRIWRRIGGGNGCRQPHMFAPQPIGLYDLSVDLSSAAGFYPPPPPKRPEREIELEVKKIVEARKQARLQAEREALPERWRHMLDEARKQKPDGDPDPPVPLAA